MTDDVGGRGVVVKAKPWQTRRIQTTVCQRKGNVGRQANQLRLHEPVLRSPPQSILSAWQVVRGLPHPHVQYCYCRAWYRNKAMIIKFAHWWAIAAISSWAGPKAGTIRVAISTIHFWKADILGFLKNPGERMVPATKFSGWPMD